LVLIDVLLFNEDEIFNKTIIKHVNLKKKQD
jgi:hypothetical protein